MPELPEVETTRRGIAPHVEGKVVVELVLRRRKLRYPVPQTLLVDLPGQVIDKVERRGKYLLLRAERGTVMVHLGMSGSLRLVAADVPAEKHDHVDIVFDGGMALRLHDPRRFGSVLWLEGDPFEHKLLLKLGPEPLSEAFDAAYLYQRSRKRKQAIKQFVMDSHTVVGVGNIYASEALFGAGIRPQLAAGRLSRQRCELLVTEIKNVLTQAIEQGGTTLRDFVDGNGKPGYFQQQLRVYGREAEACSQCGAAIKMLRLGQRASYYCPSCQR
ncbi:MAG TPA: bifunctional DNA-formamidopyrimidine glycosylase/DNA-(apurinic or apyrimidinic site) lyase [Candidatus Tenderia electrophaga]|uniref:Formamidopyrimidine-DNA glycosylase n=1 Tax=Candidatus Tenderia electrophaga TaxID=1748243 RepID=A0A832J3G8_9GAMM|nr:bifunctional DNA-formamidopyrimidine glycosylase/DNA-(apurinic or apyrimidinic site) lyase [Candidatus Tenderia electrophaga]